MAIDGDHRPPDPATGTLEHRLPPTENSGLQAGSRFDSKDFPASLEAASRGALGCRAGPARLLEI
jgi:hypothetical protein